MSAPARFLSGIATQPAQAFLGEFPLPDPFHTSGTTGYGLTVYANDFLDLGNAASRTVTGASSTFALTDGVGGLGILTPGGTTTATSVYRTAAAFQFVAGQKLWCLHRLKLSAVAGNVSSFFGLIKTGAATTDSLLFVKAAASTSWNLVSKVNNVATTLVTGVATAVADTFLDAAFYYDGTDLKVYIDDDLVARVPNVTIGSASTTLTNALLTPIMQITPTATDTLTVDYALIAQETPR